MDCFSSPIAIRRLTESRQLSGLIGFFVELRLSSSNEAVNDHYVTTSL